MGILERQLGARIARHRKALGLTQARLAEMVRVQPETVCRLETGVGTPSLQLVARTAAAIHLELHELFRFKEPSSQKELALEKLDRFASRLSATQITLLLDIGAAMIPLAHLEK
jgi:transcriptional regulator with XRE-family HTH domain